MTNEEIKKTMKENKMTYRLLADILNISHGHLHDMLNGRKNISNYGIKIERILKKWTETKKDFQEKQ